MSYFDPNATEETPAERRARIRAAYRLPEDDGEQALRDAAAAVKQEDAWEWDDAET